MMILIRPTNNYRIQAIAVRGDENIWVYNYFVKQEYLVLGIPIRKTIHVHTFVFPRKSNDPHRDGLKNAMADQRSRAGLPTIR